MIFFKRSHNIVASLLFVSLNIIASDANMDTAACNDNKKQTRKRPRSNSPSPTPPLAARHYSDRTESPEIPVRSNSPSPIPPLTARYYNRPFRPNSSLLISVRSRHEDNRSYDNTNARIYDLWKEVYGWRILESQPEMYPDNYSSSGSQESNDIHSLQRHNSPASTTHLPGQSSEQRSRSVSPSWPSSTTTESFREGSVSPSISSTYVATILLAEDLSELYATDGSTSESESDWYDSSND